MTESGQPSDDELLAEADAWRGSLRSEILVRHLASAVRRWRKSYDRVLAQSRARSRALWRKESNPNPHRNPVTREQLSAVFVESERYWGEEDFLERLEAEVANLFWPPPPRAVS